MALGDPAAAQQIYLFKIMKRFHSIKKNGDFQLVYGEGKSFANRFLVMYVRRTEGDIPELGFP